VTIVTVNDIIGSFDSKINKAKNGTHKLTLKPRTEGIVRLPNKSIGITPKGEIVPGIYLAQSQTVEINGYCINSVVNTLEREITIDSHVQLEEIRTCVNWSTSDKPADI